jgi:hypothetical protein
MLVAHAAHLFGGINRQLETNIEIVYNVISEGIISNGTVMRRRFGERKGQRQGK